MAPYRGWASSFLATTLVVTSTAMESPSWPPASRPTAASTDGAHAIFLYPTGSPTINVIDTIEVTYDTVWTTTNLTLMCEIDPVGNVWSTTELDLSEKNPPRLQGIQTNAFPTSWAFMTNYYDGI